MSRKTLLIFILTAFGINSLKAQIDDTGLWTGISVSKQITRKVEASLTEQIRFKNDVADIDVLLTDVGLDYSFTKAFRVSAHYRFINSNQDNYYSKRHRFYIDASYRKKFKGITLALRERIQEQFNDYQSSETGKVPTWILRSKLTAKPDIGKKISPYISAELYYLIDNAQEEDQKISRLRYEAGVTYDFNRRYGINPFILYQRSPSPIFGEFIYGVMFNASF